MGATGAITAVAGAYGAYSQAQAGRAANSIAKFNAGLADMQAQDAIARGAENEQALRRQGRQVAGAQRAALAGQGVDVNDVNGTAGQLQVDTQLAVEEDARRIRANAMREAFGYRVGAISTRLQGQQAQIGGYQQATGTLLTSGASVYRQNYQART